MEEEIITQDLFSKDLETLSKKPKEPVSGTSELSEWPTLSATQKETSLPASTIVPGQKTLAVLVSWTTKKKTLEDHEKDRVGKYAPYFKDSIILPIPELLAETEPKTLSFIVKDLRSLWSAPQDSRNLRS